jgi:hypothetical protein
MTLQLTVRRTQQNYFLALYRDCVAIEFMGLTNDYERVRSRNVGMRPQKSPFEKGGFF